MAQKTDKRAKLKELEEQVEETEQEIIRVRRASGKAGVCLNCKEEYEITRKNQRFCSDKCRLGYWKQKRSSNILRELTCPACNTKFTTTDGRQVYCSNECYRKTNTDRARQKYRSIA